ncbi:MAG: ThuA domain-containing protein, partial [Bacteroidales bacterium]|nr:ThuA domain-containing protein [Bacteroidales bacterium]
MKNFFLLIFTVLILSGTSYGCNTKVPAEKVAEVMIIAGGHGFDTLEFVDMFNSITEINFHIVMQPRANQMIVSGEADKYDVLIFYDMWPNIDSIEREGYYKLLNQGKGMIFLHHALCSYQDWDEFQMIIGGKYNTESSGVNSARLSTYKHDLELNVEIANTDHPVCKSIKDFTILDEGYGNIEVNDNVEVLLRTDHPDCAQVVGWTNDYKKSKIVYLMLGHDKHAYSNNSYKRLI